MDHAATETTCLPCARTIRMLPRPVVSSATSPHPASPSRILVQPTVHHAGPCHQLVSELQPDHAVRSISLPRQHDRLPDPLRLRMMPFFFGPSPRLPEPWNPSPIVSPFRPCHHLRCQRERQVTTDLFGLFRFFVVVFFCGFYSGCWNHENYGAKRDEEIRRQETRTSSFRLPAPEPSHHLISLLPRRKIHRSCSQASHLVYPETPENRKEKKNRE